ncbi:hypothetical protein [Fusobacterium sp.]|uniref:hypothetical protein n=1 Tax=Fusobacterium sp. TaxID=68766 RepID=UPI00260C04E8|nr:hypothetical protein [Fusobacterium sp.]
MKNGRKLMKILFLLGVAIFMMGCTNTNNSLQRRNTTLGSLNDAYNRKNGTEGRSMIVDTIIATTLYNHPEIIPVIGKSRTKSSTTASMNSVSNTVSNSQVFSTGNSSFSKVNSTTTTHTRSKAKTKSVTTGVGISPNLDFYLR